MTVPPDWKVVLNWPPKELWVNNRAHWSKKAKIAKKYKYDCMLQFHFMRHHWDGKREFTIEFMPPDKRRRDPDGMISAIKHLIDALSDTVGVDDSKFILTFSTDEPIKPGFVIVSAK
jgi:crossover junction endodeoxyribonuclease RusA